MFDNKTAQPKEAWVYPIHDSHHLLTQHGHKTLLDQIKHTVISRSKSPNDTEQELEMIEQHYDACYEDLLHRYAQFVQCLSEPGLHWEEFTLTRSLARVNAVLRIVADQLPRLAQAKPMMGGVEKIFFAVFSASLLYEVGRVCENRIVHLCNAKGEFIDIWDPLAGPIEDYTHFKVRVSQNWHPALMQPLTICFARSIMPKIGMLWLSDSSETMQWWFKLLIDLEAGFSEHDIAFKWEDCERMIVQTELESLNVDRTLPQETLAAETFWEWVQEQLAKGNDFINSQGALAHVTHDAVLLDQDLVFDEFMKSQTSYTDKVVLMKQFNYLGIAAKSGSDFRVIKYYGSYPKDGSKSNTGTLFGHAPGAIKSGHDSTINALSIDKSAIEGAHAYAQSQHVRPASDESWVNRFFARFFSALSISGYDHTQQP